MFEKQPNKGKDYLAKEEMEANSLLHRELTELTKLRKIDIYLLSIGKVILNIGTKLECLEVANEKLADALAKSEDTFIKGRISSYLR